ncbi:MAG: tripartite tricarboxylate transporter TctB family protein [Woeseiaceae bacterium]|nr:tripartite tricarboxylate transporter TctB family protein [Woeseiaceae bacterium]
MQINSAMNGRVATALVMFAIFASMSLLALGFPPKARLLPLLVGVPGAILGLIQLINEVRQTKNGIDDEEKFNAEERYMFLWLFIFFFGILGFGFIFASPILVFGFLYLGRKETLLVGLISAIATLAVLYGVFEKAFEIPLFEGLIVEWLSF